MSKRFFLTLLITWAALAAQARSARGRPKLAEETVAIRDFRTASIALRTDLPQQEAEALLQRLSTLLETISKYWGKKPEGTMACYVAKDFHRWPEEVVAEMDPAGIQAIRGGYGVCIYTSIRRGRRFKAQAVLYTTDRPGLVQHELVHAYCSHAFGRLGPLWYSEGMAERGQYWGTDAPGLQPGWPALRHIRSNPERTIREIISKQESGDWRDYADRWSLCVFLDYHPAYSATFQRLGIAYLSGQNRRFEQTFGRVAERLVFEYRLFRNQIERGYDVKRWAWDWETAFEELPASGRVIAARVAANLGWQASGVTVRPGQAVHLRATGKWAVSDQDDEICSADGLDSGRGRLLGVILRDDLTLTETFDLGVNGTFEPEAAGRLYLRCSETPGQLADNRGQILFQASRVPLASGTE